MPGSAFDGSIQTVGSLTNRVAYSSITASAMTLDIPDVIERVSPAGKVTTTASLERGTPSRTG